MVFRTNISLNKRESEQTKSLSNGKHIPFILGWAFFCGGILFSYLMTIGQLACYKSDNVCLIQERHIWEQDFVIKEKIPLPNIQSAYVISEEHYDSKHRRTITYSIKIRTHNGDKKVLHSSSSNRSTWEERAQKINNFLNYDIKEVVITESSWWFLFPLLFVFVGLFLIWMPYYIKKKAEKERISNPIVER